MALEFLAVAYVVCVGFVCAGILSSFYQLLASRPVGFRLRFDGWVAAIVSLVLCTFAGPFIIMRNALRGRRIEGRPIGWLFGSSAIASLWSACSGVLLLNGFTVAAAAMG